MDGTDSERAGAPMRLGARLPQDLSAPGTARSLVDGLGLPAELCERLRLGLSELVTNGVRHPGAAGSLELRIIRRGEAVRAELTDPGSGFAWDPAGHVLPPAHQIGGRGLYLIECIADRWGTERTGDGAIAWFEVDSAR
jgi:anti-sigma regulatory factor (Ser/Thr protein kinase)